MKTIYKKLKKIYKSAQRVVGKKTTIGNYRLTVDPENSQPYIIKRYPEHGMSLVRLARIVNTKYKDISIFDIGANFGDTAAMLLTDNHQYKIICIEGDVPSFALLSKNFSSNMNVKLFNVFLGSKKQNIGITSTKEGGSLKLNTKKNNIKKTINLTTVDSLISSNPDITNVKVFKIDTDGYDYRILLGSKKYLTNTYPSIYFEYDNTYLNDNGDKGLDMLNFLKDCGYEKILFYDNYGRFVVSSNLDNKVLLNELDRYIMNRKGGFAYFDAIAFHKNDNDLATTFINNETIRE